MEEKLPINEAGKAGRGLAITADDSSDSDDSEGAEVGVLALRGTSGVKSRPLGFQKKTVDLTFMGFNERVQDNPVARDLNEIFDYRQIPLQPNALSHELLEV
jgi:hypothetical protein